MAKRKTIDEREAAETDKPADVPLMVRKPVVEIPATKLKNVSGVVKNIPGMGAEDVGPGRSIPIPKNPDYVQFLLNHGFELA